MSSQVQFISIDAEKAGQRIDNFLLTYLKGVPRSRIYRLIRSGELRINKKRVEINYRLQENDIVRLPPLRVAEPSRILCNPRKIQALIDRIIYEDEKLLVLNKPAGIAVHGGSGINLGVIEMLRQHYPKKTLELVHRLDRDTSGCLLIAKKMSVLRELHEAMREQQIQKTYLLLVSGHWPKNIQHIDLPLHKNQLKSGERVVKVSNSGKPAKTYFKVLTCYPQASLVSAQLETGRTHQIRVHAAHVKHPIAGDEKYGDKKFNLTMRQLGLRRLFLHASQLSFCLPGQTKTSIFTAPLDKDLQDVLNSL